MRCPGSPASWSFAAPDSFRAISLATAPELQYLRGIGSARATSFPKTSRDCSRTAAEQRASSTAAATRYTQKRLRRFCAPTQAFSKRGSSESPILSWGASSSLR